MASYYVWSGAAGSANGSSWVNAYTTLTAGLTSKAAGDNVFVAHDHAEATATANLSAANGAIGNPIKVICVDRAGTVPPVSADRRTTAQVTTTTNGSITLNGFTHYDGIIFIAGNSTGTASINVSSVANQWMRFDNCSFRIGSTGSGRVAFHAGADTYVELYNTTMSFSAVTQGVDVGGALKWRNTPSALIGSAVPTTLFAPTANRGSEIECIGVDLSAAGSGKTIFGTNANHYAGKHKLVDCKLHASVTRSTVPVWYGANEVDIVRSGASGNYAVYRHRTSGELMEETTIVRSGGASDGTTPIAWKVVTTANCSFSMPFETPPIAIWVDTTGAPVTATVECIGATVATDQEVWLDVEYLGDASSPQGSFVNDGKANLLATAANQTSSSETWGGSTAAFKLEVTFTPQQKGWMYARVKCAKASSTFYIDPMVTLS